MFGDLNKAPSAWAIVLLLFFSGVIVLVDARIGSLLLGTASVAIPATLLTLCLSTPLAMLIGKTNVQGRRIALLLLVCLLFLPLHQVASGWLAALGYRGWLVSLLFGEASRNYYLEGRLGAILIHTASATPWATCLLAVALRTCHRPLEEQALLEAKSLKVLWTVSWRHAMLATLATGMLITISCATEIAATDLFQVRTFAEEIYTQASLGSLDLLGEAPWRGLLGLALGVGLQAVLVAWALNALRLNFRSSVQDRLVDTGQTPWVAPLGKKRLLATLLVATLLFVVVGIPLIALLYKGGILVDQVKDRVETPIAIVTDATDSESSPPKLAEPKRENIEADQPTWQRRWSLVALTENVLHAPWEHRRELWVSCQLGAIVATTSVLLGSLFAWRLRRATEEQLRLREWPLMALLALGLALPGPLVGIVTIRLLNQSPDSWFALLGELYGTWFAPWLVQMVRIVPLITIALWPASASFPATMLEAAKSDGAGWFRQLVSVIFPNRWHAILAAWFIAFALSLGELSATILVVPPGTPPLSVRVLSLLHYGVEEQVAAISLCLIFGYALLTLTAWGAYRYHKIRNS